MTTAAASTPAPRDETPIAGFSRCHEGILHRLESFAELPALAVAAGRARQIAWETLELFENGVIEHHADEEGDLFPAVAASAVEGAERDWITLMVTRLTGEHRAIEAMWKEIRPAVKAAATGKSVELDPELLDKLVRQYSEHAKYEEEHFLPLAQEILGRNGNHMAALGIALHMRHVPQPVPYI